MTLGIRRHQIDTPGSMSISAWARTWRKRPIHAHSTSVAISSCARRIDANAVALRRHGVLLFPSTIGTDCIGAIALTHVIALGSSVAIAGRRTRRRSRSLCTGEWHVIPNTRPRSGNTCGTALRWTIVRLTTAVFPQGCLRQCSSQLPQTSQRGARLRARVWRSNGRSGVCSSGRGMVGSRKRLRVEVGSWPGLGRRESRNDVGAIVQREGARERGEVSRVG